MLVFVNLRLLDGGLATHLEALGADLRDPLWSGRVLRDAGHLVTQAHEDFVRAGARMISSATYQLSTRGLAAQGVGPAAAKTLFVGGVERACAVARSASTGARDVWAAASLGSYGAHRCDGSEYRGGFGRAVDELVAFHRPQFESSSSVPELELVLFETIPSALEVEAILQLCRHDPGRTAISVVVRDPEHLADGHPLDAVVERLDGLGLRFFGINCVAPELALRTGARLRGAGLRTPLALYPNRGEAYLPGEGWASPPVPGELPSFASFALAAADLGATFVGGCCRIGPKEIAAADAALRRAGALT